MALAASKTGLSTAWWRPATSPGRASVHRVCSFAPLLDFRVCDVVLGFMASFMLGQALGYPGAVTAAQPTSTTATSSVAVETVVGTGGGTAALTMTARAMFVHIGRRSTRTTSNKAAAPSNGGYSWRGGGDEGLEPHPPFLIGVCGGTASGKTSVCRKIMDLLKADTELEHQGVVNISQDCFYKDLTPDQAAAISHYNFDHPDAFDFDEIHSSLKALKEGAPVDIPQYDFVTSARLPHSTHVPFADVILFDGIMAFHQREVRELFDLKIFVDTDADTRLARRVRRDIVERGRDIIQVLDQYEETVKPSFDSFILPTKKHADIIVPRGAENLAAIDLIHHHIRMKLLTRQAGAA